MYTNNEQLKYQYDIWNQVSRRGNGDTRCFSSKRGRKILRHFSADALKAFYNLNRDIALKKLKEVAPQRFNLFIDKRNNTSNAFFFGLSKGVASFTQSEGDSPDSPEMSFLYELGISELAQGIDDLMCDSNASQPREGVVSG